MIFGDYGEVTLGWSEEERSRFPESSFLRFDTVSSTSTLLREFLGDGRAGHFSLVVADHQTAGRGRRGDRWEAKAGSNLLFSIALRLPRAPQTWSRLPHLAAFAVGRSLESILTEVETVEAKWPNDLLVGGRKLCGILVETTTVPQPFAVVGIGLNVNMRREDFPEALREQVTSVAEVEGCEANREYLLGLILQSLLSHYPSGLEDFSSVREWYEARDFLFGRKIAVETVSGTKTGKGVGLGEFGELLLERNDGTEEGVISAERIVFC